MQDFRMRVAPSEVARRLAEDERGPAPSSGRGLLGGSVEAPVSFVRPIWKDS